MHWMDWTRGNTMWDPTHTHTHTEITRIVRCVCVGFLVQHSVDYKRPFSPLSRLIPLRETCEMKRHRWKLSYECNAGIPTWPQYMKRGVSEFFTHCHVHTKQSSFRFRFNCCSIIRPCDQWSNRFNCSMTFTISNSRVCECVRLRACMCACLTSPSTEPLSQVSYLK